MQLTNVKIVIKKKKKRKCLRGRTVFPSCYCFPACFSPEVSSVGDTINYC